MNRVLSLAAMAIALGNTPWIASGCKTSNFSFFDTCPLISNHCWPENMTHSNFCWLDRITTFMLKCWFASFHFSCVFWKYLSKLTVTFWIQQKHWSPTLTTWLSSGFVFWLRWRLRRKSSTMVCIGGLIGQWTCQLFVSTACLGGNRGQASKDIYTHLIFLLSGLIRQWRDYSERHQGL